MANVGWLVYYFFNTIIPIGFYIMWMSPLGLPQCSNGILPCQLPYLEKIFVTNPGTTDANFAMGIAVGWIIMWWFFIPAIIWAAKWVGEQRGL